MKRRFLNLIPAAALLIAFALAVSTDAADFRPDVNEYPLVFSTFNVGAVQNRPGYYPDFSVDGSGLLVQSVTTYHWNYGSGKEPGSISIYDWDDNLV